MFAAGIKVARINMRPLLPEQAMASFNPVKFLKEVERELVKRIRDNIRQETFSPAAKRRLNSGFQVRIGENSVTVIALDPIFRPLLEGRKRQQMTWLVKARAPIPIVTDTGEVIFRSATPKSMANGSWYHPGREPTTVIERAREAVREHMKGRAKRLLQQEFQRLMKANR